MKKLSVSKSLALATAAFVSMPLTGYANGPLCKRIASGRVPKRTEVRRMGPLSLRDAHSYTLSAWSPNPEAAPVRVAMRVLNLEDPKAEPFCTEDLLFGGTAMSTNQRIDLELKLFAVQMWSMPEVDDEVLVGNKRSRTRILGTVTIHNILTNNENITEWK